MRLSRPQARAEEERTLPLINIVFLLLIFFMIAGRLTTGDPFKVTPPVSGSDHLPGQHTVMILIGPEGRFALDGMIVREETVLRRLESLRAEPGGLSLHLKTDGTVSAQRVVAFLAALRKIGVGEVTLLTVPRGPE